MKEFLRQLWLLNRGARDIMFWAHLGLCFGCGVVFFLFLLASAGSRFVNRQVLGALPGQELRVGTRKEDVAMFRRTVPGSPERITPENLETMAALPGVVGAWPLRYGNQPARVRAQILTASFETDIVLQSFQPEWVAEQVPPEKLAWDPGQTVPLVVNPQILAIYNGGYAPSQGLPELSPEAMKLPLLTITYGETPVTFRARVVGYSPKVALGLAMPDQVLDYLHRQLAIEPAPVIEAAVELAANTPATPVREAIASMDFEIEEPSALARALAQLQQAGFWAGWLLVLGLCIFGGVYLNQTLKMLILFKRRDYAVCRAMGMSANRLQSLLTIELALSLLVDLGLGFALGYGAASAFQALWLNQRLLQLVGASLVLEPRWSGILAIALAVLVAAMLFLLPRIWRLAARPVGVMLGEARR